MSRHERYTRRDRTFSIWHRYSCFSGADMVDVDAMEYCKKCKPARILLLVESARDVGQLNKPVTAMRGLAAQANCPAVVLLWKPSASWRQPSGDFANCLCDAFKRVTPGCDHGVESFRGKRVYPEVDHRWRTLTPLAVASWIDGIHQGHLQQMHSTLDGPTTTQFQETG